MPLPTWFPNAHGPDEDARQAPDVGLPVSNPDSRIDVTSGDVIQQLESIRHKVNQLESQLSVQKESISLRVHEIAEMGREKSWLTRLAWVGLWPWGAFFVCTAIVTGLFSAAAILVTTNSTAIMFSTAIGFILGAVGLRKLLRFKFDCVEELDAGLVAAKTELTFEKDQCRLLQQRLDLAIHEKQRLTAESQRHDAILEEQRQKALFGVKRYGLLEQDWRSLRGVPFEDFLAEVFQVLEFQVQTTKATGDHGVDLVAQKGTLRLAVQAKGFEGSVGNDAVQEVVAGMKFYQCNLCLVVTNSRFTPMAIELAKANLCKMIDGSQIEDLILGRINFG